jgi:hypothetical protein
MHCLPFGLQVACQYLHSLLGFAGFIPYFLLEGFGISLPLIGFANIDPTYSLDGLTQMMIFFATSFLAVVCYCEYKGITDAKVFALYHYPISAAILKWQLSGNASLYGILFLSAPHMFTLWGTLAAFAPDKMPAAML